jgi:hypothetical protein
MKTIYWTMVSIDTLVSAGAPSSSDIMKSILYFASRNQCGAILFEYCSKPVAYLVKLFLDDFRKVRIDLINRGKTCSVQLSPRENSRN